MRRTIPPGPRLTAGTGISLSTDAVTGEVIISQTPWRVENLEMRLAKLERLILFVTEHHPEIIRDAKRHFVVVDRMSPTR